MRFCSGHHDTGTRAKTRTQGGGGRPPTAVAPLRQSARSGPCAVRRPDRDHAPREPSHPPGDRLRRLERWGARSVARSRRQRPACAVLSPALAVIQRERLEHRRCPGGHFFGVGHTLERYQNAFYAPLVSDWCNYETWREDGGRSATERANRIWKQLLAAFVPRRKIELESGA
ncbi:MAG: hypothetical protein EXQ94_06975 [Alphaproteobacteria bacterium]|nr:hypothetical protein [Alphaproteobacteria bacterium]